MSDLVKAQNMPQFNWYTCWTSLGANGTPYKLIKEGLKQPNQIKISFKNNSKDSNSKEITSHVAPDQAQFGVEYFLAYTLPNFKSKNLTWLSCTKGQWSNAIQSHGWVLSRRRPDQVDQHHCKAMPKQCRLYEGKLWWVYQGLSWGRCWISEYRRPADLLVPYFQEARSHADAWVHAALSTASQLPWGWLPLSNNGCIYGTREEWTNLLCTA